MCPTIENWCLLADPALRFPSRPSGAISETTPATRFQVFIAATRFQNNGGREKVKHSAGRVADGETLGGTVGYSQFHSISQRSAIGLNMTVQPGVKRKELFGHAEGSWGRSDIVWHSVVDWSGCIYIYIMYIWSIMIYQCIMGSGNNRGT